MSDIASIRESFERESGTIVSTDLIERASNFMLDPAHTNPDKRIYELINAGMKERSRYQRWMQSIPQKAVRASKLAFALANNPVLPLTQRFHLLTITANNASVCGMSGLTQQAATQLFNLASTQHADSEIGLRALHLVAKHSGGPLRRSAVRLALRKALAVSRHPVLPRDYLQIATSFARPWPEDNYEWRVIFRLSNMQGVRPKLP